MNFSEIVMRMPMEFIEIITLLNLQEIAIKNQ